MGYLLSTVNLVLLTIIVAITKHVTRIIYIYIWPYYFEGRWICGIELITYFLIQTSLWVYILGTFEWLDNESCHSHIIQIFLSQQKRRQTKVIVGMTVALKLPFWDSMQSSVNKSQQSSISPAMTYKHHKSIK